MRLNRALNDNEYIKIVDKYLSHEKIQDLKLVAHHDSNRLNHSIKVSYGAYKLCKKLHLNYESSAKAGLLHDLYFEQIRDCNTIGEKFRLFMNEHPKEALDTAVEYFDLTNMERNIILSHMWPTSKYVPKYKESVIVSLVDKFVSFFEFERKYKYDVSYIIGILFIHLSIIIFKY